MTDTFRAKQNMEILDEFKNIKSQVVGLTNRQVQGFQESIKPKTQRDFGAEVNVDKAVENINKIIEQKLGALEFVVQNINLGNVGGDRDLTSAANRTVFNNSLTQVNNSGEIIPLYNSIVRAYKEAGVSRETQQIIKVKVQELSPNLEAICYGLNQAVDIIFENRILDVKIARVILDLLRTLSVYSELKSQVESNPPRFEMFNVDLLDRVFRNIFETQSADRLAVIKEYAPRGMLLSASIRNIPDFRTDNFEERIKAMEEELGFKIDPEKISRLRGYSSVDLSNALNELKTRIIPAYKSVVDRDAMQLLNRFQAIANRQEELDILYRESMERLTAINEEDDDLENKDPLEEEEAEDAYIPLDEVPIQPVRPNIGDLAGDEELINEVFELRMKEYDELYGEWEEAYLQYRRDEDYNASITDQLTQNKAERQQIIDRLDREYTKIARAAVEFNNEYTAIQEEKRTILQSLPVLQSQVSKKIKIKPIVNAMFRKIKTQRLEPSSEARAFVLRPQPDLDEPDEEVLEAEGRGKSIDTRGLSSMKKGYGHQDGVVQKKKNNMNFDDCKNDSYA